MMKLKITLTELYIRLAAPGGARVDGDPSAEGRIRGAGVRYEIGHDKRVLTLRYCRGGESALASFLFRQPFLQESDPFFFLQHAKINQSKLVNYFISVSL